jgi:hypothetical protein
MSDLAGNYVAAMAAEINRKYAGSDRSESGGPAMLAYPEDFDEVETPELRHSQYIVTCSGSSMTNAVTVGTLSYGAARLISNVLTPGLVTTGRTFSVAFSRTHTCSLMNEVGGVSKVTAASSFPAKNEIPARKETPWIGDELLAFVDGLSEAIFENVPTNASSMVDNNLYNK